MVRRTLLAVLLVFAGCAGTPKGTVRVDLDEFTVIAKPPGVPAGTVRFEQRNIGAIAHELVVVKTVLGVGDLPVRQAEVDLQAKTLEVGARDERLRGGARRTLRTELTAGKYVLICNVPGHYQSGMRTGFVVS